MPLIHFAYGGLHRTGQHDEQVKIFLERILVPRMLRASKCPEFVPLLNSPNARIAKPGSARTLGSGGVTFDEWVPAPPVSLMPNDVWMVSFVNIPLRKLRLWEPAKHYGLLGIAFTESFRKRNDVRDVCYYQYPDLSRDGKVLALDQANRSEDNSLRDKLWAEILNFRKPAKLWGSINELFAVLRITEQAGEAQIEQITYSRYETGYDFQAEREARMVRSEEHLDIEFEEEEVLSVIVPNQSAGDQVVNALQQHWKKLPTILIHPQARNDI